MWPGTFFASHAKSKEVCGNVDYRGTEEWVQWVKVQKDRPFALGARGEGEGAGCFALLAY